jgi:uncharacterized protein DUF664
MTGDTDVLIQYLDMQRSHVVGILEGAPDDDLRRPLLPSGWSCLGMVKHLALDVEHYWLQCIVDGASLDFFSQPSLEDNGAWRVAPSETSTEIFALYREEWARSNEIIRSTPLEAPPKQRDTWWGEWKVPDLRFIVLHLIAETACHAGHLDAARELIDGRQWVVLQ